MAKKRKARKPVVITVRRTGETAEGAGSTAVAASPRRGMSRYGRRAAAKLEGAVDTARKGAAKVTTVLKEEPIRVLVGTLAGNAEGKLTGDIIHEHALKNPDGYVAKHEAGSHVIVAVGEAAIGTVAALMKGSKTNTLRRYVFQAAAAGFSNHMGQAIAIDRAAKKPLPPPTPTKKTEGPNDPFDTSGEGTGASLRMQRRRALAQSVANAMRAEDPKGAGTEGPELDSYIADLMDDVAADVQGMDEALEQTGLLPLAAAAAAPQLIQALAQLLKLQKQGGQAEVMAEQATGGIPVTKAVLELEGEAPEVMGAEVGISKAAALRKERRQLKSEVRREQRYAKRDFRDAQRREREDLKRAGKRGGTEAQVQILREQAASMRPAAAPARPRPIIVRAAPADYYAQVESDEDPPLIVVPTDDEVIEYTEGIRFRR